MLISRDISLHTTQCIDKLQVQYNTNYDCIGLL